MRYADFTLVLDHLESDAEGISFAVQAPDAAITEPVASRLGALVITELLRASPASAPGERVLVEHGCELGRALFPGPVLARFRRARVEHRARGERVRLRLLGGAGFHHIPWELAMVSPEVGEATLTDALALDPELSISRESPGLPPRWSAAARSWPVTVLAVAASPPGYPPIDVARERADLDATVAASSRIRFHWVEHGAVPTRGADAAAEIFHFAGHGGFGIDVSTARDAAAIVRDIVASPEPEIDGGRGSLVFEDGRGAASSVDAATLGVLLRDLGVRTAVINACRGARRDTLHAWSSVAASLLKSGVSNVVAMQHDLLDTSARAFATAFYGACSEGCTLDEAVYRGRIAMLRGGDAFGWCSPVLYRSLEAADPAPDARRVRLTGGPRGPTAIAWDRDGRGVLATGTAGNVVRWRERDGATWALSSSRGVEAVGDRLVSSDGASTRELARTEGEIRSWALSSRGAICLDAGQGLYAFDADARVIARAPLRGSQWTVAALGPGDDLVALFTPTGEIAVWKLGRRVVTADLGSRISGLAIADDDAVIALSNRELVAFVVGKRELVRVARPLVDLRDIRGMGRAARGDLLALQVENAVELFRLRRVDGELTASRFMTLDVPDVAAAAASPDGSAVVTASDSNVVVWYLTRP